MTTETLLSIGEVADTTGSTVAALRHYDDLGLVDVATRVGGNRRFASETVGRVNFIHRAQDAGFRLDEIKEILDERSGGWHHLVGSKIQELIERRARLDEMIGMLVEIRDCGCVAIDQCPRAMSAPEI